MTLYIQDQVAKGFVFISTDPFFSGNKKTIWECEAITKKFRNLSGSF